MRWPWQPRPGMVSVREGELLEALSGVLHSIDLEAEVRQIKAETRLLKAETEALGLLADDDLDLRDELFADLPMTASGQLHRGAFLALLDQARWTRRAEHVAQWAAAPTREG